MISCGGSSSGKTGTIVSPKSGSQDQGKFSTKSVQQDQGLVSSMWDSFTYKKLDATKKNYETAGGTSKIEHCVVEGPGSPLPIGSKVKILEEARCLYSMHIPEDDSFKKYFVSMIKIEVIDTGRTGWTWITSVKND